MTCKHGEIVSGYEDNCQLAWCGECGQCVYRERLLPDEKGIGRNDYSEWLNLNISAFGCQNECNGGNCCFKWCGNSRNCIAYFSKQVNQNHETEC